MLHQARKTVLHGIPQSVFLRLTERPFAGFLKKTSKTYYFPDLLYTEGFHSGKHEDKQ
jgi:hypothetical protein